MGRTNTLKPGKDYAFLFHNTNFSRGWTALPDTEAEIRKLATELEVNYNFEVNRYANLNLAGLRATLAEINRRPFGPNDQVLFYFSSHGYYQAGSDRGYLIPTDGPASWNFGQGWLSYDELREYLSANTAKHVLVGLDACHSGSFGKRTKGVPSSLPWDKDSDCEAISRSSLQRKSRLYFSSGNKDERTAAQSEFLSRWLQCLREGPQNGNYVISNQGLGDYVNSVTSSMPENGTFVGHDEGGGFVFVHKEACLPEVDPLQEADKAHWAGVQRDKMAVKTNEHIKLYGRCMHYEAALQLLRGKETIGTQSSGPSSTNKLKGMVGISGGIFNMGNDFLIGKKDEGPVHSVTVSPFQIGKFEVTFDEYEYFTNVTGKKSAKSEHDKGRHPVINVSWFDAISYCNWRSRQEGFISVYSLQDRLKQELWEDACYGVELVAPETVLANLKADGYRLPTEAEWEFVASYKNGKGKVRFGNGKDVLRFEEVNFDARKVYKKSYSRVGAYRLHTVSVGSLNSPNGLGIHDLAGNVWELCTDWYGKDYYSSSKAIVDPAGPMSGTKRVIRGGSWNNGPTACRAGNRASADPDGRYKEVGFRLARSPKK